MVAGSESIVSTGMSLAYTPRHWLGVYALASSHARGTVADMDVTTEKLPAVRAAACMAAWAMPSTGPSTRARAWSSPGSPKHAMT